MMMSFTPSFLGFHTAQRALFAAQTGLNVVNHNISNASVEGYSKQRVNLSTETPITNLGVGSWNTVQLGQGVRVDSITRLRDGFMDKQYRNEVANLGELGAGKDALSQLEGIVGEPSFSGLADSMSALFDAVADMRNNPQSEAIRTAFAQNALDLTTVFKQQGQQLLDTHANMVGTANAGSWPTSQVGLHIKDINASLESVAALNRQIGTIVASGASPNDLLDQRNVLLEKLSKVVGIEVEDLNNEKVSVRIGGQEMVRGGELRNTLTQVASTAPNADRIPARITTVNGGVDVTDTIPSGTIKGLLDIAGNNSNIVNLYSTFENISSLYETLATEFNALQSTGRDLTGTLHSTGGFSEIFVTDPAYTTGPKLMFMGINPNLKNNPERIALAADDPLAPGNFAGVGDNRNAKLMENIKNKSFALLNNSTPSVFHQSLVASIGTDSKSFQDRFESQEKLMFELEGRRQSVSGVNTDEEALDLLKFQRAFEASSRVIRTYNEVYQTIINMV
jgi:flagellar hook-associated protein 1